MKNYLLDTNIVSEMMNPKPNKSVTDWLALVPNENLFLSVLTLGEIRYGIERLVQGKRKAQLMLWLEHDLPEWFEGRIVPIDHAVADRWGFLRATSKRPLPVIDALLGATALVYNLTLVTRNVKDFDFSGLEIFNPFEDKRS